MCHAHVSEPRRGGSNIKVLNDDSIGDALDPSNIIASRVGAAMVHRTPKARS